MAFRCARLQTRLADELWNGVLAPRDGTGRLVEVYPAAALKLWGLPYRGYKPAGSGKAEQGRAVRGEIVEGLAERLGVGVGKLPGECVVNDDVMDALVSAMVVTEVIKGKTVKPVTEQERAAAMVDGWMHVPGA